MPSRSTDFYAQPGSRDGYRSGVQGVQPGDARRRSIARTRARTSSGHASGSARTPSASRATHASASQQRQEEGLEPQEPPEAEVRAHARGVRRAPRVAGRRVRDLRQARRRQRRPRPRDRSGARASSASTATSRSASSRTTRIGLAPSLTYLDRDDELTDARSGAGGCTGSLRSGGRLRGRCLNRARYRCSPRSTDPGPSFAELLRQVSPHQLPGAGAAGGPAPLDLPHGTTVVAIRYADGVVMAGDRRATAGLLDRQPPHRQGVRGRRLLRRRDRRRGRARRSRW